MALKGTGSGAKTSAPSCRTCPDCKRILFGTDSYPHGETHVYDDGGNKIDTVEIKCLEHAAGNAKISSIAWYDGTYGHPKVGCPTLCVSFDTGRLQSMQNVGCESRPFWTRVAAVCPAPKNASGYTEQQSNNGHAPLTIFGCF